MKTITENGFSISFDPKNKEHRDLLKIISTGDKMAKALSEILSDDSKIYNEIQDDILRDQMKRVYDHVEKIIESNGISKGLLKQVL